MKPHIEIENGIAVRDRIFATRTDTSHSRTIRIRRRYRQSTRAAKNTGAGDSAKNPRPKVSNQRCQNFTLAARGEIPLNSAAFASA
jgi:hypothetical protein